MSLSLRYSLMISAAAALVSAIALACTSGSDGSVGSPCQSSTDCATPQVCLAVDDAGMCSPESNADGGLTCQRACSTSAECEEVGSNYTCTQLSVCAMASGMSGVCTPIPATQ